MIGNRILMLAPLKYDGCGLLILAPEHATDRGQASMHPARNDIV